MRKIFAITVAITTFFVAPLAMAQSATFIPRHNPRHSNAPVNDPPFHERYTAGEVLIRDGENLTVEPGENDLYPERTLSCRSAAGCRIVFAVMINITESTEAPYQLCSFVDGVEAKPKCFDINTYTASTLQTLQVTQGKHVIQTQFLDEGTEGVIGEWQVVCNLYEKPNRKP